MKKNNQNKNNLISISPPAPPASSLLSSPESTVPEKVPARSASSPKSLPSPTVSVKFYPNSDTCKDQILSDNKNKSGIYMFQNSINDKKYIGSAINLSNRLSDYYSTGYMENALKRSNSHIYRALLKYGYENFSLTILEYCEPEKCIEREDYYLCSLPHEYNILPKAGSWLGHKHSDKTKQILSEVNKGNNHPNYGKARYEGSGRPSQAIEVTDIKNDTTISYDSISEAAKALNIKRTRIVMYFSRNQTKPYKGQYTFKKL